MWDDTKFAPWGLLNDYLISYTDGVLTQAESMNLIKNAPLDMCGNVNMLL